MLGKFENKAICLIGLSFFDRYQSETKQSILVGSQSSTYIEFKLKRQDSPSGNPDSASIPDDKTSSRVQVLYHQAKDFILHRTLFLIISGIFGS